MQLSLKVNRQHFHVSAAHAYGRRLQQIRLRHSRGHTKPSLEHASALPRARFLQRKHSRARDTSRAQTIFASVAAPVRRNCARTGSQIPKTPLARASHRVDGRVVQGEDVFERSLRHVDLEDLAARGGSEKPPLRSAALAPTARDAALQRQVEQHLACASDEVVSTRSFGAALTWLALQRGAEPNVAHEPPTTRYEISRASVEAGMCECIQVLDSHDGAVDVARVVLAKATQRIRWKRTYRSEPPFANLRGAV
eukprot:5090097-Pleurochrysis_carterae.AAC.4